MDPEAEHGKAFAQQTQDGGKVTGRKQKNPNQNTNFEADIQDLDCFHLAIWSLYSRDNSLVDFAA